MSIEKSLRHESPENESQGSVIQLGELFPDLKEGCYYDAREVLEKLEIDDKYLDQVKKEVEEFQDSLEEESPYYKDLDRIYEGFPDDTKKWIQENYKGIGQWKKSCKKINMEYAKLLEKQYDNFSESEKRKYGPKEAHMVMNQDNWKMSKRADYIPVIALAQKLFKGDFKDKTIIEIGPGTKGQIAMGYLASKGARVIGVDKGEKQYYKGKFVKGVDFVIGDFENLPLKTKADLIYIHHSVIDVRTKEERAVKEIDGLLKPNGFYLDSRTTNSDTVLAIRHFEEIGYLGEILYVYNWWKEHPQFGGFRVEINFVQKPAAE